MIKSLESSQPSLSSTPARVERRILAVLFFFAYTVYLPFHLAEEPHSRHFGESASHQPAEHNDGNSDSSSDHSHSSLDHSFNVTLKKQTPFLHVAAVVLKFTSADPKLSSTFQSRLPARDFIAFRTRERSHPPRQPGAPPRAFFAI